MMHIVLGHTNRKTIRFKTLGVLKLKWKIMYGIAGHFIKSFVKAAKCV